MRSREADQARSEGYRQARIHKECGPSMALQRQEQKSG